MAPYKRKRESNLATVAKKSRFSNFSFNVDDDNGPAGIIEKITLKNFMCHDNLEYEFHPNINFILGLNGSGKSAIMTGIMLALGGASSTTGRNSKIEQFIKHGKQVATLELTLKNTGPDAYNPFVYGPRIIVERKINSDGSSNYKIKCDEGRVISIRKGDLVAILNALNIQIDNPVSLLTQNTSKTFMTSTQPGKKYELFYRATCLEQVYRGYSNTQKELLDTESKLRDKEEVLTETQKEIKKLEQELKKFQTLEEQREKIKELKNALAWLYCANYEKDLEACKQKKSDMENAIDKLRKAMDKYESDMGSFGELVANQEAKHVEIKNLQDAYKHQIDQFNELTKELKTDRNKFQEDINRINSEMAQNNQTMNDLECSIQEMAERTVQDIVEEQRRKDIESNKIKSDLKQLLKELNENEAELTTANEQVNVIDSAIQQTKEAKMNTQQMITYKKREIGEIERSFSNTEYRYGEQIPELLRRINDAHSKGHFQHKPVGPLGLHLSVPEPQWLFPVETCLGRPLLQSFCCDNVNDTRVLYKIMDGLYQGRANRPQINTGNFLPQVHDVRMNKVVSSTHRTVYDLISTSNPVVMNCLIDQRNIENILLIEKSSEAVNLMMDHPPRNCSSAFVMNGDHVFPDPKYRYYSCKFKPNANSLLKSSTQDDLSDKKQELMQLEKQFKNEANIERQNHQKLHQISNESKRLRNECQALQRLISEKSNRLKELEVPEVEQDVTALHTELQNFERKKEGLDALKQEIKQKLDETVEKIKQTNADFNSVYKSFVERKQERQKILDFLKDGQETKEKLSAKINRNKRAQEEEMRNIQRVENEILKASDDLQEYTANAEVLGPRVDTDFSIEHLQMDIQQKESVLRKHEGSVSKEDVLRNFTEKKQRFNETKGKLDTLVKRLKKIKSSLVKKLEKFKKIQQEISVSAQYRFTEKTALRNYIGQLIVDHEKKNLEIWVDSNPSGKSQKREAHALSGGERSFVLVSLLLSLWDVIESPFRVLDEYDVFMDTVNRFTSMRTMIENAKSQKSTQYIFLTPLDLPHELLVNIGPNDAMIRRLEPAIRARNEDNETLDAE